MDLIMESRGNRAWGTSRLAKGSRRTGARERGGLGLGEHADWGKGSSRMEPGRARRLARGSRRPGPGGAGTGQGGAGTGPVGAGLLGHE
jgi:hypothetical protein